MKWIPQVLQRTVVVELGRPSSIEAAEPQESSLLLGDVTAQPRVVEEFSEYKAIWCFLNVLSKCPPAKIVYLLEVFVGTFEKWDIFDQPSVKPDYAFTPETTWWFDDDKAVAIGMAG